MPALSSRRPVPAGTSSPAVARAAIQPTEEKYATGGSPSRSRPRLFSLRRRSDRHLAPRRGALPDRRQPRAGRSEALYGQGRQGRQGDLQRVAPLHRILHALPRAGWRRQLLRAEPCRFPEADVRGRVQGDRRQRTQECHHGERKHHATLRRGRGCHALSRRYLRLSESALRRRPRPWPARAARPMMPAAVPRSPAMPTRRRTMRPAFVAAALLALPVLMAGARAQTPGEILARTELRVCADPNDLPFSNEKGEGYE